MHIGFLSANMPYSLEKLHSPSRVKYKQVVWLPRRVRKAWFHIFGLVLLSQDLNLYLQKMPDSKIWFLFHYHSALYEYANIQWILIYHVNTLMVLLVSFTLSGLIPYIFPGHLLRPFLSASYFIGSWIHWDPSLELIRSLDTWLRAVDSMG